MQFAFINHLVYPYHSGGLECVGAHVVNYRLADMLQLKLINVLLWVGEAQCGLRCRVMIPCINFVFDYISPDKLFTKDII